MPVLSWSFVADRNERRGCPSHTRLARAIREWHPGAEPDWGDPDLVRNQDTTSVSHSSPISPTLRANPFPEVTDLTCRLPLPTLIYRLEAVHLGDRMRIWVRISTKVRNAPPGFSSSFPRKRGRRKKRGALSELDPLSERLDSQGRQFR